ncbi:MAG: DNRLRE domain-containing protein [Actinobacteria bacterium]|nr:DNRLRE domain-containing protein [Actinomycetota bacterium]
MITSGLSIVPAVAAGAEAKSGTAGTTTLANVPSEPAAAPTAPAVPLGDFSNPPSRESNKSSMTTSAGPTIRVQPAADRFRPGKSVELPELRKANEKTFLNPDGSHTTQVFNAPVHVLDSSGKWEDLDTTLTSAVGGRFKSKTTQAPVDVAAKGTDAVLGRLTVDANHSAAFAMAGARQVPATVAGDVATYTGIQPGVDLRLASHPDGLKEDLVLASKDAPDHFVFPLTLKGLTASIDSTTGDVVYRNSAGTEVARTPHGWMADSNVDPKSGEPARSFGVVYRLVDIGKGHVALDVQLDRAWLQAPERQFPVTVDPSYWLSTTLSDDTYVQRPFVNNQGFWSTDSVLKVGHADDPGLPSDNLAQSFMHFDVSGLNGKQIVDASFYAYETWSWSCAARGVGLYRITQPWSTSDSFMQSFPGASYADQVAWGSFAMGHDAGCPAGWAFWDITPTVTKWTNGTWDQYGLMLKVDSVSEGDVYAWKKFASWNTALATSSCDIPGNPNPEDPYLTKCIPHINIDWQDPAPPNNPPTAPAMVTPPSPGNGTGIGTLTPQLQVSSTDPDGDAISYRTEVSTDPGFGSFTAVCDWGGPTCNPTGLAWNRTYYWRAWSRDATHTTSPAAVWSFSTPNAAPSPGTPLTPPNGNGITTLMPILEANAGSDPNNDALRYWFRLSADDDPEVHTLWDSGWLNSSQWVIPGIPSAKVVNPAQPTTPILKDGATYSWKLYSTDDINGQVQSATWKFKVSFRLGDQPSSPLDAVGPVTVNLATGNVVVKAATPTMTTVSGPMGISFTYNSLAPAASTPALPQGWSMSLDDEATLAYSGLLTQPNGESIVLVSPDGGTSEYRRTGTATSTWAPLNADDSAVVTQSSNGDYIVQGGDGITYRFGPDGQGNWVLQDATQAADDQGHPSSLFSHWDTTTGRLSSVEDPVSHRSMNLIYGGGSPDYCFPPTETGISTPAPGRLCRIEFTDGANPIFSTKLGYDFDISGPDQIIAIQNPPSTAGGADYDETNFVYANQGAYGLRMTAIRSPLANDNNQNPAELKRTDSDPLQLMTVLGYYTSGPAGGKVASVELPRALQSDPSRIIHSYGYSVQSVDVASAPNLYSEHTDVTVDDADPQPAPPAPGAPDLNLTLAKVRHVYLNLLGQVITDQDPAGNATHSDWWPDDRVRWTTDASGRRTGTAYDPEHRVAHVYGPAPVQIGSTACFSSVAPELPSGNCAVPDTSTAYDGTGKFYTYNVNDSTVSPIIPAAGASTGSPLNADGSSLMRGLIASYWAADPNGQWPPSPGAFIGQPVAHELIAPASGTFDQTWSSSPPGIAAGNQKWLARLTGEVVAPQPIDLRLVADDGVQIYVDDQLQSGGNFWGCCVNQQTQNNGVTIPIGVHRIRIDYFQDTLGAHLQLVCVNGCSGSLPLSYLSPRLGLVTSTRDADGKITTTQYGDTSNATYAADIARANPMITTVDPGGANLKTTTIYEPVGAGTYARLKTKQLPRWYGNLSPATMTTSTYYDGTVGKTNPCLPDPQTPVIQSGLLWKTTGPDPAGPDQARVEEQIYDVMGRVAATRAAVADQEPNDAWTCAVYDDRGQVTSSSDRLGNTTTNTYLGLRTASTFPDSKGVSRTTTQDVDLLGRPVRYTDEWGTVTRTVYDYLGRAVSTYRTLTGTSTEVKLTDLVYNDAGGVISTTEYSSGVGRTSTFTYDPAGRLLNTNRPNQVNTVETYNDQGAVATLTDKRATNPARQFSYTRTAGGRIVTESESVTAHTTSYLKADGVTPAYDGAGRLTRAVDGATIRTYDYDSDSNRCSTSSTVTDCSDTAYEYDEADRITASPFAAQYHHDLHGNVDWTKDGAGNFLLRYTYDGNDHATSIDDGATVTTDTLTPSGRVLEHVVAPSAGGPPTVDLIYGYAGSGDSPAYQINNLATSGTSSGSQPRSSASAHNNAGVDTTLVTPTPAGVLAGDVMIAAIATRGVATVSAPTGWNQIGTGIANGSSMTVRSYWKLANGSEPASYAWTLSEAKAATGSIVAYSGVDSTNPIDVTAGSSNLSNSTSIVAPSVTTTAANERVVGLFATMATATPALINPPTGMVERGEDSADANAQPPATLEVADFVQSMAGATGDKTATANAADRTTGQQIALRNAPPPTGTITARSWTAGHNDATTTSVVVTKPTGTASGDVLIAGIATRGTPTVTAPTGWTLIRTRETGSSWTLQSYYHVAGSSEPTSYTWTLSVAKAAAGTVTAYTGVDTTSPIDVTSGHLDNTAATSITATGVTTTAGNDLVVGIFENTGAATFTPPAGMTERGEDQSNAAGQSHVDIETADISQTTAGATGDKIATGSAANTGAAELVALRAAPSAPPATTSVTTMISGPSGLLVIDTNGTPAYPLANAHGDVIGTVDATGVLTANPLVDEFGKAVANGQPVNGLGWLGDKERFTVAGNGTIRMGVRLYDPNLGRFLSVDPVEGGSASDYDYAKGDPVNDFDLDGRMCFVRCGWGRAGRRVARVASVVANATSLSSIALVGGCALATVGSAGIAGAVCLGATVTTWATIGGHAVAAAGYAVDQDWGAAGHSAFNAGWSYLTRNSGATRAIFGSGRGFAFFQVGIHLPIAAWKWAYNMRQEMY